MRISDWSSYVCSSDLSTRLGADLTDAFGVSLVGRYSKTSLSFTGDDNTVFPSIPAAARSRTDNRQFLTRAEADLSLFDGRFKQTLGVGYVYQLRRPNRTEESRFGQEWVSTFRSRGS